MNGHARQHDPDQIVPPGTDPSESGTGPSESGTDPFESGTDPFECRGPECPRQLATTAQIVEPPPSQGFWGSLTEPERAALLAAAEEVVYPIGTALWFEGQVADQALVIRSGSVRVSVEQGGRERIIAFRGPGDIVGERAALMLRLRSATVVAMDSVHGLRMTTQQIVAYLSDHPRVLAVMEREVYDRLTEPTPHPPYANPFPSAPPYPATRQSTAHPTLSTQTSTTTAPPQADTTWPGTCAEHAPTPPTGQPLTNLAVSAATAPPHGFSAATDVPGGSPYAGVISKPSYGTPAGQVPAERPDSAWAHPLAGGAGPVPGQPAHFQAPWAGPNCTIVYTDIAGFSAAHRNDADRLDMRRAMYAVLRAAFEESRVPWESCHVEDRGDGALIVIPPEVPTAVVIDPMLAALAVRLRQHNRRSSGAVRIQLRVAVGVGPVLSDPPGVSGFVLIHTARLLDARPLKERLAVTGADLGFIVSQFVYESFIAHGAGYVNPAEFEPISCRVKKLKTEGWVHLRGVPARSAV
ncbi:cyclic nucleotide-binding domain-containing protein [Actinomadura sp. 6K520]|uniref:cyclic nucleotide-binding domain-containing protein n=1 Tax=Actinomadura sp. 6K520 TaxID=2530364 RepID=UPI00104CA78B|nr:cyclic nucleotide-binding domain-containing protein [Actinomadura sp. 6K520]TDE20806.1 cyclic nucleotide-binding domain-containing protein [Actinomadura sp. 6K520]